MSSFIKKNGLLYSEDMHTVIGVDDTSADFTGRVPFGAHKIDDDVFSECPYESVSLPDSITELGKRLFENSKALEKVKLPSGVTELPPYLFAGCSALSKVTMPGKLESLPEGLFKGCESLTEIPFRAGIAALPASVFEGCSSLKSLVLPPTVKRIESRAVADCSSLESVVFPAGLEYIADDAFDGCTSLRSIRMDGEGSLFYVGDNDGCLYYADDAGDRVIVQVYGAGGASVGFFKDDADELSAGLAEEAEDEFEDDDTFSAEIGAADEEALSMGADVQSSDDLQGSAEVQEAADVQSPDGAAGAGGAAGVASGVTASEGGEKMSDSNNVDSMLADIMGAQKERENAAPDVGISERESEILSHTMSVMSESNQGILDSKVADYQLEELCEKNERDELATHNIDNPEVLDSKAQILSDSAELSFVINCEPAGEVPEEGELYVVAEKLVTGDDGKAAFSPKLVACCKTFARIHDYRKVLMLYGLPIDNDEFVQFFKLFVAKKNVIFASEAESPSKLSEYGKKVCELARISLNKDELAEQRRSASVKTDGLVKLVIRDKYE